MSIVGSGFRHHNVNLEWGGEKTQHSVVYKDKINTLYPHNEI